MGAAIIKGGVDVAAGGASGAAAGAGAAKGSSFLSKIGFEPVTFFIAAGIFAFTTWWSQKKRREESRRLIRESNKGLSTQITSNPDSPQTIVLGRRAIPLNQDALYHNSWGRTDYTDANEQISHPSGNRFMVMPVSNYPITKYREIRTNGVRSRLSKEFERIQGEDFGRRIHSLDYFGYQGNEPGGRKRLGTVFYRRG